MKGYTLLLACISCGGAPFTEAPVIMTDSLTSDASPESTFIGSEADVRQSEPSIQPGGAVLPMGVDSGDASEDVGALADRAETDPRDGGVHDGSMPETSVIGDASPDSPVACVASACSCPSGYYTCCKTTGCGCVSAIFPQGCY